MDGRTHKTEPHCVVAILSPHAPPAGLLPHLLSAGVQPMPFSDADTLHLYLAQGGQCQAILIVASKADTALAEDVHHLRLWPELAVLFAATEQAQVGDFSGIEKTADATFLLPHDMTAIGIAARVVCSLVRRMQHRLGVIADGRSTHTLGQWRLSGDGWSLQTPDERVIPLSQAERALLQEMTRAASAGTIASHEALMRSIARDKHDADPHRLEVIIYRLRKKVSQVTLHPLPIRAVRARGYLCRIVPTALPELTFIS